MKSIRDITLGEMQDECKRVFGGCSLCRVRNECVFNITQQPRDLDLSDPPRFNDAQMAFLRGCYGIGIVGMMRSGDGAKTHLFTKFETIGFIKNAEIPLETGETLDLAELFGKEG